MQDEKEGDPPGSPGSPTGRSAPGATRPGAGDPLAPSGRIGAQLRALYDAIEREPIPNQLIDLLDQLDEAERRQSK